MTGKRVFKKFGDLLKKQRKIRGGTIYDVAAIAGVSNTYISQMESGQKLPSPKVLFTLAYSLDLHSDNNFAEKLIKSYAEYKGINEKELFKGYDKYKERISKEMEKIEQEATKYADDWMNNRIETKKKTLETKRIEKPYFDLKWLLTQKEYEVFYGREYDIQGTQWKGKDIMDKMLYNRLHDEDIKIIHDMIEVYISHRYGKVYEEREAIREEALKATGHKKEGE